MKLKKLLAKAEKLLDPTQRERDLQNEGLKKLIKKLRKYEHATRERAVAETDPQERERLETKIRLAHAQRKKALELLGN